MAREKRKQDNKFSGIAIALWILVMGVMFFYIPVYFDNDNNVFVLVFNILGWIFIAISAAGSLTEVSKLIDNEGFSTVGVSLVFIIPCVVLYMNMDAGGSGFLYIFGKLLVVVLFTIGTGILFYGISYFFPEDWTTQIKEEGNGGFWSKLQAFLKGLTAVLGALSALLAGVLKLLDVI